MATCSSFGDEKAITKRGLVSTMSAACQLNGCRIAKALTPVVAASLVGICLPATDVELPAMLLNTLKLLAALAIPTALLAFGMPSCH
jgi:hypothetical protein